MNMETILYAACVEPLKDAAFYAAAYALLPHERQAKADRYRFEKDRCLSVGAGLLMMYALRACGADAPVELAFGAQGKPELKNGQFRFNLSHSGEWVLCAVSPFEVGCDLEMIGEANLRVASRFFSPEEYRDILAQPSEAECNLLFYRYWTLRESFMKATGLGMKLSSSSFVIMRGESIGVRQSVDKNRYVFREFGDIPGYCCALCTAGDCGGVQLVRVDLKEIVDQFRG